MRSLIMSLFVLLASLPIASAQSGADFVKGLIGGVAAEIIQQTIQGGGNNAGAASGGQTMFGMTCPGQWVNNGSGYMCRCPNGQFGNLEGSQVVCPGGGQRQQTTPRASAPQLTDAQKQEQLEQERLRKEYAQERRKCLDKNDLDACQLALTFSGATVREREALLGKAKAIDTRQKIALEKQQRAQALEEERRRQAAQSEQRNADETAARAQAAAAAADLVKQQLSVGQPSAAALAIHHNFQSF